MSKKIKISLIIALALLIAGGFICAITLALNGWRIGSEKLSPFEKEFSADAASIYLDLPISDLKISSYNGDKIIVKYQDSEKSHYTFSEENGALSIIFDDNRKWYEHININFGFLDNNEYTTTVLVPSNYSGQLEVRTNVGEVELEGLNISADSTVNTDMGSIEIKNCTFDGNLTAAVATGEIDLDYVKADSLKLSVNLGSIDCEGLSIDSSLSLSVDSGDIDCSLTDGADNYNITSSVSLGDSNLTSRTSSSATKSISAEVDLGDIDFSFGFGE